MRRYRRIGMILLLAAILLMGCGSAPEEEESAAAEGALVYYLSNQNTRFLTAHSNTEGNDDSALRELFLTLRDGEYADGHSALPKTLELDHTAWQENCLVLYLTGDYPAVGSAEETLCRAALVQTLLPVAEADTLSINLDDEPLKDAAGVEVGQIRPDGFVMDITNNGGERRTVNYTVYYVNAGGTALVRELRQAEVGVDESDAAVVLNYLIRGTAMEGHGPSISPATSVLGVSVRDGICYVNLSDAFLSPSFEVPNLLQVYAVVNSLTELPDVEQVQLTVNGTADISVGQDLSLAVPLTARADLVEE